MVEVDVADLVPRFSEFLERARRGEQVVVTHDGQGLLLSPITPPENVEDHLAGMRRRLAGGAPPPTPAEFDAEIAAMRGRG